EHGRKLAAAEDYRSTDPSALLIALGLKKYPEAKAYLRQHGWTEEQIAALPVLQAVLMYEVAVYDRMFDEFAKWINHPYESQRRGLAAAEDALKREVARIGAPGLSVAGYLLPAVHRVIWTGARVDRRIAALRCVEAIRMYAAAHGGQLPLRMDAITDVPI